MLNFSYKMQSGLKLAAVIIATALVTGCFSVKTNPGEQAVPAAPPKVTEAPVTAKGETMQQGGDTWTVAAGDSLWRISAQQEVYNVPEKWPLIYKSNLSQIKDADLIYPGQVLTIRRNSSQSEINRAIEHAKTRGAWALGPIELLDQDYIRNSQ